MNVDLSHHEQQNLPSWAKEDPLEFWRTADAEERANGRLYVEIQGALPRELSQEGRIKLAQEFAKTQLGKVHPYTLVIHNPRALDGGEQPHFHLMFSERRVDDGIEREQDRFFRRANSKHPERGGAKKEQSWQHPSKILELRQSWEHHANEVLSREGHRVRIDHRSLKDQGINRTPEPKLGSAQTAMLMKGKLTPKAIKVLTLRQERIQERVEKRRQLEGEWVTTDVLQQRVGQKVEQWEQELEQIHQERIELGMRRFWNQGMWHYPPPRTEAEIKQEIEAGISPGFLSPQELREKVEGEVTEILSRQQKQVIVREQVDYRYGLLEDKINRAKKLGMTIENLKEKEVKVKLKQGQELPEILPFGREMKKQGGLRIKN